MNISIPVNCLDIDRLLAGWRWLCPEPMTLVARNAFGDLFLQSGDGKILLLEVEAGRLTEIATTIVSFHHLLDSGENREQLFAELEASRFAERGFVPGITECIGFKMPLVFAECSAAPDNVYIADLYERISFLGDLHRQIADMPDGAKIRLRVKGTL